MIDATADRDYYIAHLDSVLESLKLAMRERDELRAALDMIYKAEGDHPICQCPVHQVLRDA